ncbi:MAG: PCRF domain-containing protein, partial [Thermodesulfobacteriota bacterium]
MIQDRLKDIEKRYEELSRLMADPEVLGDQARYRDCARERSSLEGLVEASRELESLDAEMTEYKNILEGKDAELRELAKDELPGLQKRREELIGEIRIMLLPKDPNDEKNVILEIRGGTGGEESALFASELFRMYQRYAERMKWRVDVLSSSLSGTGGLKEVIATVEGRGAYSRLKYESGVHRVQRVPETEASGRIHTSTATVAVMPEAEEVEVDIKPD